MSIVATCTRYLPCAIPIHAIVMAKGGDEYALAIIEVAFGLKYG